MTLSQNIKQRNLLIEYTERLSAVKSKLNELKSKAENHFGSHQDELTWAHVEDLDCILQLLTEASTKGKLDEQASQESDWRRDRTRWAAHE